MPGKPLTSPLRLVEPTDVAAHADLPPVVARMVVEIRSDGSRTIARGALEDRRSDRTVTIEAEAGSPWELSRKLVGALVSLPSLARAAARALVPRRPRR